MGIAKKLVLGALLSLSLTAAAAAPLEGRFAGWVDIDAAGKLNSFAPDGAANPALADALRQELQQLSFVPARWNGTPVAVRTYVTGNYTLEERGDEYVMRVAAAEVGPKQVVLDLPKPPLRLMTMNEPGWVRVGFTVGRDGKPRDVLAEDGDGPTEMRRNVRESVMRWRFEPETVDGIPIETYVRVDFTFAKQGSTVVVPNCPDDATGRVRATAQPVCRRVDTEMRPSVHGRTISVP
jgi:TonB family protein